MNINFSKRFIKYYFVCSLVGCFFCICLNEYAKAVGRNNYDPTLFMHYSFFMVLGASIPIATCFTIGDSINEQRGLRPFVRV